MYIHLHVCLYVCQLEVYVCIQGIRGKYAHAHMNESCHIYEGVMPHISTRYVKCHVTHMNESCHTYEWVMSHISTSHFTYMNESFYTYEWVMSHIRMSHVTHINESSFHIHERVILHVRMSRVTRMNESRHTYEWVTSHIWMSHVTHMNVTHMGWHGVATVSRIDKIIGHFSEYSLFYRALLQKRRIIQFNRSY